MTVPEEGANMEALIAEVSNENMSTSATQSPRGYKCICKKGMVGSNKTKIVCLRPNNCLDDMLESQVTCQLSTVLYVTATR